MTGLPLSTAFWLAVLTIEREAAESSKTKPASRVRSSASETSVKVPVTPAALMSLSAASLPPASFAVAFHQVSAGAKVTM